MIPVTKPFLPPIQDYIQYIEGIWQRQWLTNMGPLSNELELQLKEYLEVDHLLYVTNGTVALQLAIKALGLSGEIITTPFSFVATTSSIVWEGCTPVFVDINPKSLNLDARTIEKAITENTTAILATHVYGNPCDIDLIGELAIKYNLKVIYDAAHAFGVRMKDQSIFNFGDISICSLHATKLYHSIEGGLIITRQPELLKKLSFMRNFGFNGPEAFEELGINGKNSELHAAMGLINLKYVDGIIQKRKQLTERYLSRLRNLNGFIPEWHKEASKNYAYFPVVFEDEKLLLKCFDLLQLHGIYARRYFYPCLPGVLPYTEAANIPIAEDYSRRVLCLPLYYDLSLEEVDLVARIILRAQNN